MYNRCLWEYWKKGEKINLKKKIGILGKGEKTDQEKIKKKGIFGVYIYVQMAHDDCKTKYKSKQSFQVKNEGRGVTEHFYFKAIYQ